MKIKSILYIIYLVMLSVPVLADFDILETKYVAIDYNNSILKIDAPGSSNDFEQNLSNVTNYSKLIPIVFLIDLNETNNTLICNTTNQVIEKMILFDGKIDTLKTDISSQITSFSNRTNCDDYVFTYKNDRDNFQRMWNSCNQTALSQQFQLQSYAQQEATRGQQQLFTYIIFGFIIVAITWAVSKWRYSSGNRTPEQMQRREKIITNQLSPEALKELNEKFKSLFQKQSPPNNPNDFQNNQQR